MEIQHNEVKGASSKIVLVKLGVSVFFLFFIYIIWSATSHLTHQLKLASDNSLAIHHLEVEHKNGVQEWKNLLLRSENQASLNKNWQEFELKHQAIRDLVKDIIEVNEVQRITDPLWIFISMHDKNFEKYKAAKELLVANGMQARLQADAIVFGIDRPLVEQLEKSAVAMQEEQNNVNDRVAGVMSGQIGQYLIVLALISLLLIWMPKW
ncbi:MAG: hypothetical protein WCI39_01720 [Gallionellaceae bacterium]